MRCVSTEFVYVLLCKGSADAAVSIMLTLTRASIWCRIMGLLAKSTKGLGTDNVRGRRRVPKPPTRISAFIVEIKMRVGKVKEKRGSRGGKEIKIETKEGVY